MYQSVIREMHIPRRMNTYQNPISAVNFQPRPQTTVEATIPRPTPRSSWFDRIAGATVPRPTPRTPGDYQGEATIPRPMPQAPLKSNRRNWVGRWTPETFNEARTMGALADDTTSTPPSNTAPSSAWDNFFSGLAKVATPAAQALLGIKMTGLIQQQQQKTMASTWNPTLTNPALQAQAYQNAYNQGTGTGLPVSMGTLALLGAGAVALFLIVKK